GDRPGAGRSPRPDEGPAAARAGEGQRTARLGCLDGAGDRPRHLAGGSAHLEEAPAEAIRPSRSQDERMRTGRRCQEHPRPILISSRYQLCFVCFSFFIASSSLFPSGTPRPVTGSQPFPALNAPLVPLVTSKKADGLA